MAKLRNNKTTPKKHPNVTLSISARASTSDQIQAGKRLFSKLVARAKQQVVKLRNESQLSNSKT